MSSYLEKISPAVMHSQSTKMTLVAVAASLTTAAVLLGYQGSQRKRRVKQLKDDLRSSILPPPANFDQLRNNNMGDPSQQQQVPKQTQSPQDISVPQFDEELVREQLARNIAFLGEEGVEKLRNSFVIIVGAGTFINLHSLMGFGTTSTSHTNLFPQSSTTGGVGSWAASMLIRSGVGKIRIIDFDQVSLSSLNRHATAVQADVGTPKVISMKKAFRQVAPWVQVDARVELFQEDSAEELLSGKSREMKAIPLLPRMYCCFQRFNFCTSRKQATPTMSLTLSTTLIPSWLCSSSATTTRSLS